MITLHSEKLEGLAPGTAATDAVQLGQLIKGLSGPLVVAGIGAEVVVLIPGFLVTSKVVATCNAAASAPLGGISIDHSVAGQITIQSDNAGDAGFVFDYFGIL